MERRGKVRRVNNHRDPPSRSNFAPRRVSKGGDWQNIRRCSINWRITSSFGGQCHLQKIILYATRTAFDLRAKLQKTKRKRQGERGDGERREKRKFARLERTREKRNEPIKVQSSCTLGASGCRDVTCGYVYTVSPRIIIYVSLLADFIVGITISANGPSLAEYLTLYCLSLALCR